MLLAMSSIVASSVNDYLRGDEFHNHFASRNWSKYETIGLVDISIHHYEGLNCFYTVTIFCAGTCPWCTARYSRNVCIQKFGRDNLSGLITNKVPSVASVKLVNTTDDKFWEYAESLDLKFDDFLNMSVRYPYQFFCDILMSHNPMVDGSLSFLQRIGDRSPSVAPPIHNMTFVEFICTYRICWIVNDYSKVLAKDGTYFEGILEIVNNKHLLYGDFKIEPGEECYFLFGEGARCFAPKMFQTIYK